MASIETYFGRPAACIGENATVAEAAKILVERGIGALVVTDRGGEPVGLVGEREFVARVLVPCRDACATPVSEVMSRELPSVSPHEAPDRCSELMRRTGTRHLIVRDQGRLAGVVSMRDVIRALLEEREEEVRQLTGYITGSFG